MAKNKSKSKSKSRAVLVGQDGEPDVDITEALNRISDAAAGTPIYPKRIKIGDQGGPVLKIEMDAMDENRKHTHAQFVSPDLISVIDAVRKAWHPDLRGCRIEPLIVQDMKLGGRRIPGKPIKADDKVEAMIRVVEAAAERKGADLRHEPADVVLLVNLLFLVTQNGTPWIEAAIDDMLCCIASTESGGFAIDPPDVQYNARAWTRHSCLREMLRKRHEAARALQTEMEL